MSSEVCDLVASISNREVVGKPARVQSRSSKCEPEGNFDGFLAFACFSAKRRQREPGGLPLVSVFLGGCLTWISVAQPNLHIPLALLEFGAARAREKKFAQHRQVPRR